MTDAMLQGFQLGIESAARVGDFYATENFRLAQDTILIDPMLAGDFTDRAMQISSNLTMDGHGFASAAHVAQHLAAAIRKLTSP